MAQNSAHHKQAEPQHKTPTTLKQHTTAMPAAQVPTGGKMAPTQDVTETPLNAGSETHLFSKTCIYMISKHTRIGGVLTLKLLLDTALKVIGCVFVFEMDDQSVTQKSLYDLEGVMVTKDTMGLTFSNQWRILFMFLQTERIVMLKNSIELAFSTCGLQKRLKLATPDANRDTANDPVQFEVQKTDIVANTVSDEKPTKKSYRGQIVTSDEITNENHDVEVQPVSCDEVMALLPTLSIPIPELGRLEEGLDFTMNLFEEGVNRDLIVIGLRVVVRILAEAVGTQLLQKLVAANPDESISLEMVEILCKAILVAWLISKDAGHLLRELNETQSRSVAMWVATIQLAAKWYVDMNLEVARNAREEAKNGLQTTSLVANAQMARPAPAPQDVGVVVTPVVPESGLSKVQDRPVAHGKAAATTKGEATDRKALVLRGAPDAQGMMAVGPQATFRESRTVYTAEQLTSLQAKATLPANADIYLLNNPLKIGEHDKTDGRLAVGKGHKDVQLAPNAGAHVETSTKEKSTKATGGLPGTAQKDATQRPDSSLTVRPGSSQTIRPASSQAGHSDVIELPLQAPEAPLYDVKFKVYARLDENLNVHSISYVRWEVNDEEASDNVRNGLQQAMARM
jgi:hypothetical protein